MNRKEKKAVLNPNVRIKTSVPLTDSIKDLVLHIRDRIIDTLDKVEKKAYLKAIGSFSLGSASALTTCAVLAFCSKLSILPILGITAAILVPGFALGLSFLRRATQINSLKKEVITDEPTLDLPGQRYKAEDNTVGRSRMLVDSYFRIKENYIPNNAFDQTDKTEEINELTEAKYARFYDEVNRDCNKLLKEGKELAK